MTKPLIASKLPDNYDPLKDDVYMSPNMLRYFKDKLEHIREQQNVIEELHCDNLPLEESDYLLHQKIEEAICLIEKGCYGYCQITGEAIGIACLICNPITKYCEKIQMEKIKKTKTES